MDNTQISPNETDHEGLLVNNEIDEVSCFAPLRLSDIKGIVERERRHHSFVKTPRFSDKDEFRTVIGDEYTLLLYLEHLEKFAINIEGKNWAPIIRSVDRKGRAVAGLTRVGLTARNLCREYDPEVLKFYARHKFSPRLAAMLDAMSKWAGDIRDTPLRALDDCGVAAAPIEAFVAEIRRTLKSKKIVSAIKNHRRMERQNFRSCWNYMRWLFDEKRSRMLILRIDLYYRALAKDWGASVEAQEIHARFLRSLREDRIIKDVMGSISRREIGIDRGVHYHILCAIDGHLHRDAANLTRILGEHWVEICGEDPDGLYPKAAYFNCFTLKDFYKFNCIGLVRADNKLMMKGLEIAIRYLCKETCHLKPGAIEIRGKDGEVVRKGEIWKRNIRKGIVKKNLQKKRGAPRKNPQAVAQDPMSAIRDPSCFI